MKRGAELDREIQKLLRDIFEYLSIDKEHAKNATVRTYVERFINENR